jgi:Protein of unknown function (DUF3631)
MTSSACSCGVADGRRYIWPPVVPEPVCFECYLRALGHDGAIPESEDARMGLVRSLLERHREADLERRRQTAPADTAALLGDLRAFITSYVVLPCREAADLLALWTLHTWAFEAAFATPYLRITSATPDSGKTLLLEVLAALTRNGWHAVNPSTAVLYRKIDAHAPTLLLDEIDNYPVSDRRDALSVLNAGYKRGATVDRCKENGDLQSFACYCPKAYAGLDDGPLVATLLSRSITIRLERKRPSEHVDMWIGPLCEPKAVPLRERCAAWADLHFDTLRTAHPELPAELANRAAEVWWALLAISDQAAGDWPARARRAARTLATGGDAHDDVPQLTMLLADVREAFGTDHAIFTERLLSQLNAIEERPWGSRRRGEGLDARGLAAMLRPLKIKPRTIGSGEGSAKGYRFDQFADAFGRYLVSPSQASEASHPNAHGAGDATDATGATDNSERTDNGAPATPEQEDLFERLNAYGDQP